MDAGASPVFPPEYANDAAAQREMLDVIRRAPSGFGLARVRWRLQDLVQQCPQFGITSEAGMSRLLERLHISYKRGRDYVHSPDLDYRAKCRTIANARWLATAAPERVVLVYLDEVTFYRHPSVAQAWEETGTPQPRAVRGYTSDTTSRIIGAINLLTGQLTYFQRSKITAATVAQFYRQLRQDYPDAETIYVVLDNWSVHFHPKVLSVLQPQPWHFPPKLPQSWLPVSATPGDPDGLPIVLLNLPTYASWLNPIEKLWRWLKQDVLHLHRHSFDWHTLKHQVNEFLEQFVIGSSDLLHYVGLLPD